jgi:hypothetical protein
MRDMKTINEIKEFAQANDAVAFEKWCDENKIYISWLDVNLMDYNEDYYNVYLPNYAVNVLYYNGKLEEIS